MKQPDVWLRGPVAHVPALLQPAAHALLQAVEDVDRVVAQVAQVDLWRRPTSAASLGFHLKHLSGATERLMSYGMGRTLSPAEREWLALEPMDGAPEGDAAALGLRFWTVVQGAINEMAAYPESRLTEARGIGRAQQPTTALGCFFHAGEHASRHAGQLITTAKLLGLTV